MIVTTDSAGSLYTTTSQFVGGAGTEYTTTWTTTNANGSVQTKSGVVIVTTDSAGSLYTTTSQFDGIVTYYVTTCVTTKSDGSVETDSVVIVSTDKEGSLHTSASLFDIRVTTQATSWTTTLVESVTTTVFAEIIISTDESGEWFTTTSFPDKGKLTAFTTHNEIGEVETSNYVVKPTNDAEGNLVFVTVENVINASHTVELYMTTRADGVVKTVASVETISDVTATSSPKTSARAISTTSIGISSVHYSILEGVGSSRTFSFGGVVGLIVFALI